MVLEYGYGPATDRQEGIKIIRGAVERGVTFLTRQKPTASPGDSQTQWPLSREQQKYEDERRDQQDRDWRSLHSGVWKDSHHC